MHLYYTQTLKSNAKPVIPVSRSRVKLLKEDRVNAISVTCGIGTIGSPRNNCEPTKITALFYDTSLRGLGAWQMVKPNTLGVCPCDCTVKVYRLSVCALPSCRAFLCAHKQTRDKNAPLIHAQNQQSVQTTYRFLEV